MKMNQLMMLGLVVTLQCTVQVTAYAADPRPKTSTFKSPAALISLKPNAQVKSQIVHLGDIATISGSDEQLRRKLLSLDLNDSLDEDDSILISQQQIVFRMKLAGIDLTSVAIRGNASRVTSASGVKDAPDEPAVSQASALRTPNRAEVITAMSVAQESPLEREILQAAKICLLNKLPWNSDSVEIRLQQALPIEVRKMTSADGYVCEAELRSTPQIPSRATVQVVARATGKPTFNLTLQLDVRHFDMVALATKPMERGHVITAADVYVDRRDVTDLADYCTTTKDLIGMTVRRPMRALTPMRLGEVESQRSEVSNVVVVKRRQGVKIVASVGAVSVSASGEAMEEGRVGDIVRVRNLDSNSIIQGRIKANGEIEVSF